MKDLTTLSIEDLQAEFDKALARTREASNDGLINLAMRRLNRAWEVNNEFVRRLRT
jgi:hypothetical protein